MSADTNTPEEEHQPEPDPQVRLQKFLASAGLGSRRHCEEYITDGRVTVDGETVTDLGVKVDPHRQVIQVDGERLKPQKKRYYLLNKPPGYVCTNHDPMGRPRAIDLVPQDDARLFTVGRLDENSRGLILITNDGELAHRMAHPRFSISRRYQVQVAGKPTPETLKQLREGIHFADGKFFVSRVHIVKTQGKSTILEIELHQGRNRELRRMLARVGHKVMSLERVTFGPLKLGSLGLGKSRSLRESEMTELRELADKPQRGKSGKRKPAGGKSHPKQGRPPKKRGGKSAPSGKPKRKPRRG
ncbi:MAG: rRNA pseudouridine synthase [Planctomycetaceae bacterium]|nr:rRNA pseudouridine synthase [Planctomycetaceae bacterium]